MRNKKYRSVFLTVFLAVCAVLGVVLCVFILDTTGERIFAAAGSVFLLSVAIFIWLVYVEITDDSIVFGIGGRILKNVLISDIEKISMSKGNEYILIRLKSTGNTAIEPRYGRVFGETISLTHLKKRDREAIAAIVGEIAKQIDSDSSATDTASKDLE